MLYLKYIIIVLISVFILVISGLAIKTKKPFKILFFNAFLGITTLAIINLTAKFTGAYISINEYTVTGCGIFGIPAIIFFLILRFIFV